MENVNTTVGLLCKLDLVVHSDKSILKPTQKKYNFLIIYSGRPEKTNCIILKTRKFLTNPTPSISHLFRFDIGWVISLYAAVQIGKLYQRTLEKENILLLKEHASNFEANKNNRRIRLAIINSPLHIRTSFKIHYANIQSTFSFTLTRRYLRY